MRRASSRSCIAMMLLAISPALLFGQDPPPTEPIAKAVPAISEEPRTIDPAAFMPEKLAVQVTVDFPDSSLREIAEWIQAEQGIPVLLDNAALSDAGILPTEPVSDRLRNEPLYLLLNRLRALELAWYFDDDIVHITTEIVAAERMTTESYNVGALIDAGYTLDNLLLTIQSETGGTWEEIDGEGGSIQWLGDVFLVRQNPHGHQMTACLLAALAEHGRETFVWQPPQHIALREKLDASVSVNFVDVPLSAAVSSLVEQTGADLRLASVDLRDRRISGREPVSLVLSDRSLRTVLQLLLAELDLGWMLRDGVLWITTRDAAEEHFMTAVYDVRDLCQDDDESTQLAAAILSQTGAAWIDVDGEGGTLTFAKTGTMVVRHNEETLRRVAELLAMYRQALTSSKPRPRDDAHARELLTRYYRVPTVTASGLIDWLPQVVEPESWLSKERPDAPGAVLAMLSSPPEVLRGTEKAAADDNQQPAAPATGAVVVPQTVLVIRQTRAAHEEIGKVIGRIENGDPPLVDDGMLGVLGSGGFGAGGGLGGEVPDGSAGFGGGFFSQPSRHGPR